MILLDSIGTRPAIDLFPGLPADLGYVNYTTLIAEALSIAITLIIAFWVRHILVNGRPGKLQALFEWLHGYVKREVANNSGPDWVVPLAGTLGLYILVANWLDILPLAILGLNPATADLNQTLALALVVFCAVEYYTFKVQGVGGYLHRLTRPTDGSIPVRIIMTPINIIEEIVKPITLALRLFGNLFAGAVMIFVIAFLLGGLPLLALGRVSILGSLMGGALTAVWKAFDVFFIGIIQAFIFMLLTIVYFGQAREGLDEEEEAA